jgi:uncharacterized cupin superfamily protein
MDINARIAARMRSLRKELDARIDQQIWVFDGKIDISIGGATYALEPGDCLAFCLDQPTAFHNPYRKPVHYAVVVATTSSWS